MVTGLVTTLAGRRRISANLRGDKPSESLSYLYGDYGDDRALGGRFADLLVGGLGNDVLTGYGGPDTLHGRGGADDLYGYTGDDRLHGGDGLDETFGGTGTDSCKSPNTGTNAHSCERQL